MVHAIMQDQYFGGTANNMDNSRHVERTQAVCGVPVADVPAGVEGVWNIWQAGLRVAGVDDCLWAASLFM